MQATDGDAGGKCDLDCLKKDNEKTQENVRKSICDKRPRYICEMIFTDPANVTPSVIQDRVVDDDYTGYGPEDPPTVNGQTFTPAYGRSQAGAAGLELLMMAGEFLHFNTPFYSAMTGSYAQGLIPVVHNSESGINTIAGVGVYNHTGMDLNVRDVFINNFRMGINESPISAGNVGAVTFKNPARLPTSNISVQINFQIIQSNGVLFGTGQINYEGPNFYPMYGPPAP